MKGSANVKTPAQFTKKIQGFTLINLFHNEHINGILSQALKLDKDMKLVWVSPNAKKSVVRIRLNLSISAQKQIEVFEYSAKDFFTKNLDIKKFAELFPEKISEDLWE